MSLKFRNFSRSTSSMWTVQGKDAEDIAASAANADNAAGDQTDTAVQEAQGDASAQAQPAAGPAESNDPSAGPQSAVNPLSGKDMNHGTGTNGKRHVRKRVEEAGWLLHLSCAFENFLLATS